jgi:Uncharacterized protein conserved in bacteria
MELIKSECHNDGVCIISEEVISKIAGNSALEIEGVYGLASQSDSKFSFIKNKFEKPIKIFSKENETIITISVVIKSNYKIPEVAAKIQKNIKDSIQNMTGTLVSKVNIKIDGIKFEEIHND